MAIDKARDFIDSTNDAIDLALQEHELDNPQGIAKLQKAQERLKRASGLLSQAQRLREQADAIIASTEAMAFHEVEEARVLVQELVITIYRVDEIEEEIAQHEGVRITFDDRLRVFKRRYKDIFPTPAPLDARPRSAYVGNRVAEFNAKYGGYLPDNGELPELFRLNKKGT